jgi:hypothetical protein
VLNGPLDDSLDVLTFNLGQRIEYIGQSQSILLAQRIRCLRVATDGVRRHRACQRKELSHGMETTGRL